MGSVLVSKYQTSDQSQSLIRHAQSCNRISNPHYVVSKVVYLFSLFSHRGRPRRPQSVWFVRKLFNVCEYTGHQELYGPNEPASPKFPFFLSLFASVYVHRCCCDLQFAAMHKNTHQPQFTLTFSLYGDEQKMMFFFFFKGLWEQMRSEYFWVFFPAWFMLFSTWIWKE